jgi:hypothetical protein
MQRMMTGFKNLGVLFAILLAVVIAAAPLATAQTGGSDQADIENFEQVPMTDAQVKGYIAASPRLSELFDRMDSAGTNPDPKLDAELENIGSNIGFVLSGINEDDGSFREPLEVLKEELAAVQQDPSLESEEKQQLIASIKESIELTPKLKYPGNVDVVRANLKALVELFQ